MPIILSSTSLQSSANEVLSSSTLQCLMSISYTQTSTAYTTVHANSPSSYQVKLQINSDVVMYYIMLLCYTTAVMLCTLMKHSENFWIEWTLWQCSTVAAAQRSKATWSADQQLYLFTFTFVYICGCLHFLVLQLAFSLKSGIVDAEVQCFHFPKPSRFTKHTSSNLISDSSL